MKAPYFRSSLTLVAATCVAVLEAAPPAAPSDFIFARSDASDRATLEWVDNSTDETYFQFEIKIGNDAPFVRDVPNSPGANETSFTFTGFTPGNDVTFRLRAVKPLEGGGAGELEVSDWTEAAVVITENHTIESAAFAVPAGVAFSTRLEVNFEPELFQIEGDLPSWLSFDESEMILSAVDPPAGNHQVSFSGSSGIHFRTGSLDFDVIGSFLSSAVTGTPGEDFTYQLEADFEPDSFEIEGELPSWLSFDETEWIFSAVDPPEGNFKVSFSGTSGTYTGKGFVYFNVVNIGPTATGAFNPLTFVDDPPVELDLSSVFEDPDFIRAAAVRTDYGDLTIGFYEGFPVTVGNFFDYASSGAWDGAFFHRMAKLGNGENFVLQGGGFKPSATPGTIARVTQLPAIVNEFDSSRPNFCGTISMAKLGGDPDSATNQFFISLNDNRTILDGQNGGFTVFGRAANIEPANRMAVLPRGTFSVELDGSPISFSDWPLTNLDENSLTHDQLASMNEVMEIPTLEFSFSSDGDEVVLATVGPELNAPLLLAPTGLFGMTQLTITATDLDRASVSTTIPITVLSSYSGWSDRESAGGPNEMSDLGALTNFEEYAYGGDPTNPLDDATLPPTGGIAATGHGSFTFRHRKFASDLSYVVQSSSNLGNWIDIWTTDDGFESANVIDLSDEGEIKVVTVRSDQLIDDQSGLFFRLVVTAEEAN